MRAGALGATAGAAVGAAAVAWGVPGAAAHLRTLSRALGVRTRLDRPGVALTFDDGPHPEGTLAVLDELARRGAVATFFLVGEQVERYPDVAAAVSAAGHEIALHGHRHALPLRRGPAALARDLDRAAAVIEEATGRAPACYRPPHGVFSAAGLAICRRRGWTPTLWSRWGRDWAARATPEGIARRAACGLTSGDIVLLHDADHYSAPGSWRRTVAALPWVLDGVLALGEPLVTVTPG